MTDLPKNTGPRLAVRALIVNGARRLLLVNAYGGQKSDLWCAPGGGVERHQSLPDNLIREVYEETGLSIEVGGLAGINEFHEPHQSFHQVDLFFRATVVGGEVSEAWQDPEGVVNRWRFFTEQELRSIRHKPDQLAHFAFGSDEVRYDALERLVK